MYLATVDEHAVIVKGQEDPLDGVASLDDNLESVCVCGMRLAVFRLAK